MAPRKRRCSAEIQLHAATGCTIWSQNRDSGLSQSVVRLRCRTTAVCLPGQLHRDLEAAVWCQMVCRAPRCRATSWGDRGARVPPDSGVRNGRIESHHAHRSRQREPNAANSQDCSLIIIITKDLSHTRPGANDAGDGISCGVICYFPVISDRTAVMLD